MPLNTANQPGDEAPFLDGDDRFLRVVMRGKPSVLGPGEVALAINCRFREGVPETRRGSVKLPWLNQITGSTAIAWNSVQGPGHFVDADKNQWTLLAVNGGVQATLPHNGPHTVPLPAGVTLGDGVQFLQFGRTVLLLRGAAGDPLQATDPETGFGPVPAPSVPGMSAMPQAIRGVVAGDRVWLVTTDNEVWASDLLDHTTYHPLNQFNVGDGADEIVTLALFGQTSIIVFLKKSVYRLTEILNPDPSGLLSSTTAPRVTARYGCLAAASVVDLGNDLAWWCQDGVALLSLTTQGEIQVAQGQQWPPMFSNEIQPLIDRVRGDYAGGITAELAEGRLYIAVPLDAAEIIGPEEVDGRRIGTTAPLLAVAGATYRFRKGAAGDTVIDYDKGITYTESTDFVAGSSMDYQNLSGLASITRVYKGVNNAILVYDFKAVVPGWQGHDEADQVLFPKYFFRREYNGRERLFYLNGDGWATMYEEGPEDALGFPFADVTVSAPVQTGNTINVNGAGAVTAVSANFNPGGNQWGNGLGDISIAAGNLYLNSAIGYGAPGTWPATFVRAYALGPASAPAGVRFISSDGRRPAIVTTGAWATVVLHQWQPIRTEMLSRGYATPARLERKTARKLQVLVETWEPAYSVALLSEGVKDERQFVTGQTRSRTRYAWPFDRQAWLRTNVNNDFDTPGREDYSLNLSTPFKLGDGLGVELHQEAEHDITVRGRARAHQVRLINETGLLRVAGIGYEGRRRERAAGIKV